VVCGADDYVLEVVSMPLWWSVWTRI